MSECSNSHHDRTCSVEEEDPYWLTTGAEAHLTFSVF